MYIYNVYMYIYIIEKMTMIYIIIPISISSLRALKLLEYTFKITKKQGSV